MKVHIGVVILIIFALLALLYFAHKDKICYYLPVNSDPEKFGKFYWRAFHDVANKIPCAACRKDAVPLFSAIHDYVNLKLGKPLYNSDNFYKFVSDINKIKIVNE